MCVCLLTPDSAMLHDVCAVYAVARSGCFMHASSADQLPAQRVHEKPVSAQLAQTACLCLLVFTLSLTAPVSMFSPATISPPWCSDNRMHLCLRVVSMPLNQSMPLNFLL